MRLRPVAAFLLLASVAPGTRGAFQPDRIVLLIDNRSTNPAATAEVSPAVREMLRSKGYEVVADPEVIGALQAARLEGATALEAQAAAQLCKAVRAEAVLMVTVSFFLDARDRERGPRASPAFGLGARMVSSSGKVWRNSLGWIADEVPPKSVFRKAAPRPTAQACERLLWSMPRGRVNPEAASQVAALEQPAKASAAVRFDAPVERRREFRGVAHFPLRINREK